MRRRHSRDNGLHVITLHKDRSVELDNNRLERSALVNTLVEKVRRNRKFINTKGRRKPRPTNVIIKSPNKIRFEEVLDFMDLIHGIGVRVVALDIPSFKGNAIQVDARNRIEKGGP